MLYSFNAMLCFASGSLGADCHGLGLGTPPPPDSNSSPPGQSSSSHGNYDSKLAMADTISLTAYGIILYHLHNNIIRVFIILFSFNVGLREHGTASPIEYSLTLLMLAAMFLPWLWGRSRRESCLVTHFAKWTVYAMQWWYYINCFRCRDSQLEAGYPGEKKRQDPVEF